MQRAIAVATATIAGCAMSADVGALEQPTTTARGASATAHVAICGGGVDTSTYIAALGVDTRVDIARDSSRWAAGASALGGVKLASRLFATARVGSWKSIVVSSPEGTIVPSFELGGYVPLDQQYDRQRPEHGASSSGLTFGVREDLDDHRDYFTVFVGYALFLMPGY